MKKAKKMAKTKEPKEIVEELTNPDDIVESLKGLKQASNLREAAMRKLRGDKPRMNLADECDEVEQLVNENHPYIQEYTRRREVPSKGKMKDRGKLPLIILYDKQIIGDIRNHIGSDSEKPVVLGIDKTFNVSSAYVTVATYRQQNLVKTGT